jgi:hypothetical protein
VRLPILLTSGALFATSLAAQQPPPSAPPAAAAAVGPATQLGLTVRPKWEQSPERQREAEQECYAQAQSKTGVDPAAMAAYERELAADSGTTGVVGGRRLNRQAEARAGQLETFKQAMRACLESSGYEVH